MTSVLGLLGSDLGRFLIVRLVSRDDGDSGESLGCCMLMLRSGRQGSPVFKEKGLREHPAIGITSRFSSSSYSNRVLKKKTKMMMMMMKNR